MIQKMIANLDGKVRFDTMEGRNYLVVPMVMLTEGVHAGSGGSLYYPEEELAKCPQVWNCKPVVVYHPTRNGSGVSACDPIILSNRKVGTIMNAHIGDVSINKTTKVTNAKSTKVKALKAEAWLEQDRVKNVDERIAVAIEQNQMMELSTGLYVDSDKEGGEWNGEKYDAIARNYRPDHLAILPDMKGACSIEDGAGFLRNESIITPNAEAFQLVNNAMSHNNIRSLINSWLTSKYKDAWTADVYDNFFVYEDGLKYYKMDYSITDNSITVSGQPEEVVKVTEYRTKDGTYVGNDKNVNVKEQDMSKEQIVNKLIETNSNSFVEKDRETLMAMNDDVLKKLSENDKLAEAVAVENAALKTKNEELGEKLKVKEETLVKNTEPEKPETTKSYIEKAPPEIQSVLNSALAQLKSMQEALVAKIMKNERNTFTKEALLNKGVDELKAIAALSATDETDFTGQAIGNTLSDSRISNSDEAPLLPPKVMSA